jgi:AcrR family transcriptional regulator
MPRHSDPEVQGRILNAARKLWHKGGETALSMRAIAKAARTNTPAVYRRFRTREEILRALVRSYQEEFYSELVHCQTLQEAAECAVEFALRNPHEYELQMSDLLPRTTQERPNLEFVAKRCARWYGGEPSDYEALVLTVAALAHGIATLGMSGFFRKRDFPRARAAMSKVLEVTVAHRERFRGI